MYPFISIIREALIAFHAADLFPIPPHLIVSSNEGMECRHGGWFLTIHPHVSFNYAVKNWKHEITWDRWQRINTRALVLPNERLRSTWLIIAEPHSGTNPTPVMLTQFVNLSLFTQLTASMHSKSVLISSSLSFIANSFSISSKSRVSQWLPRMAVLLSFGCSRIFIQRNGEQSFRWFG